MSLRGRVRPGALPATTVRMARLDPSGAFRVPGRFDRPIDSRLRGGDLARRDVADLVGGGVPILRSGANRPLRVAVTRTLRASK